RTGISCSSIGRHCKEHIAHRIAESRARRARRDQQYASALEVQAAAHLRDGAPSGPGLRDELQVCLSGLQRLFRACDAWLRDPDDSERYDLSPRADDVLVTCLDDAGDGRTVRRKVRLSELL